jgi:hypothetical protein
VNYFHIGGPEDPRNAQRPELNRTLWKMLADHAGHNLRVVLGDSEDYERMLEEFVEVGDDGLNGISFEKYLKDWPG